MQVPRSLVLLVFAALASICTPVIAEDFKQYPGSKLDEKASHEASQAVAGTQSEVYTTADGFDKVYGFYKSRYKEIGSDHRGPQLSDGKDVLWAFFVLDGAKDLAHSKYWMKIQFPYVAGMDAGVAKGLRNVSVIQTAHKP